MRRFPLFAPAVTFFAALTFACAPIDDSEASDKGLRGFGSDKQLSAFAEKLAKIEERELARYESYDVEASMSVPMPAPASAAPAEAAADASSVAGGEQITNVQEAGVDEGGIVKNAGDYLIVLRRGRLFTVKTGDDSLTAVHFIDAFPPGKENPGRTWYDEMLVYDDQIIVIGYSYGSYGTEVNRFQLSGDGTLSYRDTHYLKSGDYYSSSNYASRLIGDELIFYTPGNFGWRNWEENLPALRQMRGDGSLSRPERLVDASKFYVAAPYRSGRYYIETLHIVTRCKLSSAEFDCEASTVAGSYSRAFYVSREAVYVWTAEQSRYGSDDGNGRVAGLIYRLPLDGSRPGAIAADGAPIDQFSFLEDRQSGALRVLLRASGGGDAMWSSEFSSGDLGLLTVPLDQFDDGRTAMPLDAYRKMPRSPGYRLQNRYVGRHLMYASADYGREGEAPYAFAVALDRDEVTRVELPHGVSRFDVLGSDAVAIGASSNGELGFSSINLGGTPSLESTYLLPAAGEGETRSQAFYFRPDPGAKDGESGTLGLPVTRRLQGTGREFLGSGSSIFFLRRDNLKFSPAGELIAATESARRDNCIASCVDWYGNARPIFMGNRIFALMGYELVEGRMNRGQIAERRRVDFAPSAAAR